MPTGYRESGVGYRDSIPYRGSTAEPAATIVLVSSAEETVTSATSEAIVLQPSAAEEAIADRSRGDVVEGGGLLLLLGPFLESTGPSIRLTPSGTHSVVGPGGTSTLVLEPSAAETIVDAGSSVLVLLPATPVVDATTATVVLSPSGAEATADASSSTVVLVPSGSEAETPIDPGGPPVGGIYVASWGIPLRSPT